MSAPVTRNQKRIIWSLVAVAVIGVAAVDISGDRAVTCALSSEDLVPWVHDQLDCE